MRSLVLGAMVALLASTTWAADSPSTLTLSATGRVSAEPDEGYITAGVTTVAPTSTEAVRQNTKKMSNLFTSLSNNGVAKKDFRTVQFNISQNYKEIPHPTIKDRTKSVPDGFRVSNMVRVTVCDLGKFGDVLDSITSNGANNVSSISFGSSESAKHVSNARAKACEEVMKKAATLSKGLGFVITDYISVSEQRSYGGQRMYSKSMARDAAPGGESVPVSGGSLDFTSTLNVQFKISKAPRRLHNPPPQGLNPPAEKGEPIRLFPGERPEDNDRLRDAAKGVFDKFRKKE